MLLRLNKHTVSLFFYPALHTNKCRERPRDLFAHICRAAVFQKDGRWKWKVTYAFKWANRGSFDEQYYLSNIWMVNDKPTSFHTKHNPVASEIGDKMEMCCTGPKRNELGPFPNSLRQASQWFRCEVLCSSTGKLRGWRRGTCTWCVFFLHAEAVGNDSWERRRWRHGAEKRGESKIERYGEWGEMESGREGNVCLIDILESSVKFNIKKFNYSTYYREYLR